MRNTEVILTWDAQPQLVVEQASDGLVVTADATLSQAQVESACAELGEDGEPVLQAWRAAVGLESGGGGFSALAS